MLRLIFLFFLSILIVVLSVQPAFAQTSSWDGVSQVLSVSSSSSVAGAAREYWQQAETIILQEWQLVQQQLLNTWHALEARIVLYVVHDIERRILPVSSAISS